MRLTVPEKLLEAATRLKDNKVIYCGLDEDIKEVISIAQKQDVLATYYSSGAKDAEIFGIYEPYGDDAYCLPDDIEIVSEEPGQTLREKGIVKMNNRIDQGDWVRAHFVNESGIYKIIYCPTETDHFWECVDYAGNPAIIMRFDVMYKVKVKQLPDGTYEQVYDTNNIHLRKH